jgi:hypothetical protein
LAGLWLATRLGKSTRFTSYAGAAQTQTGFGTDNHDPAFGSSHHRESSGTSAHKWDNDDVIEGEAEEKTTPNNDSHKKLD